MIIHKFEQTFLAEVLNRPAKKNKSPYLADIILKGKKYMAHTPSLGLSGLIKTGAKVLVEENNNKKNVSQYKIVSVKIKEFETNNKFIYVGANPVLVNKLFQTCIEKKIIKFPKIISIKPEVCFNGSRIDFKFVDTKGVHHYIECKYAPTVDYHPEHKPVKNVSVGKKDNYQRASIFPDGWQYKKGAVVSERAIKHLKSLIKGVRQGHKCYNFYFSLRDDVIYFRPNYEKDIIFSNLLEDAVKKGVIVKAFKLKYSKNNIKFVKEIPVIFKKNN